jgi:O-antigen/teichoic acid export membrane protein
MEPGREIGMSGAMDHTEVEAAGWRRPKQATVSVGETTVGTVELSGRLLTQNTLLNLVGQALPLFIAVITIPYVVRGLGTERFGLLSLAWVVLGYLTVFDLGLGRATTKYVAELVATGEEGRVQEVIWTSAVCQLTLGALGGFVLLLITPLLVDSALRIPADLAEEARSTFAVLAVGVPFVLVSTSLFGALEGCQRFDLVNAVRIPASAGMYLLPVVGLAVHVDLPRIVSLTVLWRAATVGLLLVINRRVHRTSRAARPSPALLHRLLGFGAWVAASNVIGPILVYLDRFLVGALVSVAAVGYYAAPYGEKVFDGPFLTSTSWCRR